MKNYAAIDLNKSNRFNKKSNEKSGLFVIKLAIL
jgi:hypothetical protein